jgi:tetratricopeptide (TPR) repeat protein/predicted Ser/Thr protein kinase
MPEVLASHYRVMERLGKGGMGEVYLAEDLRLHRPVALKLLRGECSDEAAEARLLHEARTASALVHPNVAVIYEVGAMEFEGQRCPFVAMEYVKGLTLTQRLGQGRLPEAAALDVVRQVAEALAEAHELGIVHRDLKPSNVMTTESGRVKVLDFGLAKYVPLAGEESDETWSRHGAFEHPGGLMGTLAYMSPEQALGRDVDSRSDIFSLGVLLYELLTGRQPFKGTNAVELIDAILHQEPPPAPEIGPGLRRVLDCMLVKDREKRYASLREVSADLLAVARGESPRALEVPGGDPAVAVMSLTNITRSGDDDWLGTGIAETLTTDLKTAAGLVVISRERIAEALRKRGGGGEGVDDSVAVQVARAVGARYVVTGGYQRQGGSVRVTARITDLVTGEVTRTVKLDGSMDRIFELQDRIARDLSAGLRPVAELELAETGTRVMEAYEAYNKGLINLRTESNESLDRAILFFERAIAADPAYAQAHLHLGSALDVKGAYLGMPELQERAVVCFRRSLELRPNMDEAWRELGASLVSVGRVDEGIDAIQRALVLDPANAAAHASLGRAYFIGQGDFSKAAAAYEKALALNPEAGWAALQLAHCLAFLGEFERGEAAARRAVVLEEQLLSGTERIVIVGAYVRLGQLLALQGRHAEARAQYEREMEFLRRVDHALKGRIFIELHQRRGAALGRLGDAAGAKADLDLALEAFERRVRMGSDEPYTRYYAAVAYALRGDAAAALDCLEKAARHLRAYTVARARIEPDLDSLRGQPRFEALLA